MQQLIDLLQPGYCTGFPRSHGCSYLLKNFPHSGIRTAIRLTRKILQEIKALTDLMRQLMQHPGWLIQAVGGV
jgi:hypothetical protein